MIHAIIDDVIQKNIVGYECGTKADFELRHWGNPLWVFFDDNIITNRINTEQFLTKPQTFYIDKAGELQSRIPLRKPPLGYEFLLDKDGSFTTDKQGVYYVQRVKTI
jgi:hypothetical protein